MEAPLVRRLAAIFSADVAGYTRLLAADETGTIRALSDARERITASVIRHGGRVVDSPGDNVLAEFVSALDAMRASVEIQRVLRDRAATVAEERRMLLRIGLHLGDVAVEGARIYGDGVNVAARLQTLAEPGGICLSAAIHDNVASRLDLGFVDLGEQALKNFPRPVRAFRLGEFEAPVAPVAPPEPRDRPSLVVLPFANVSDDAAQEHFADGTSEDLIAELARIPGLFVIGRSTSFAYKGRRIAARELGRELGVKHVVEGSVRRSGSRVRITARLSDAQGGQETWSERYDRELGDVFALQDEVVGGIVAELRRALGVGLEHTPRARPVHPDVWSLLVQGRTQVDINSVASAREAQGLLLRCVALDPEFALGFAELARSERLLFLLNIDDEPHLERGLEHVRRALELDPDEAVAHMTLGLLLGMQGDDPGSVAAARRAIELAPSNASLRHDFGALLATRGDPEEAITVLKNLTRLDPVRRPMHLFHLAMSYRRLGRIDEAIAKYRESARLNPDFFAAHMNLASVYASIGDLNHARASLAELMRIRPDFSIARIPRVMRREFVVENLRKLGVPE